MRKTKKAQNQSVSLTLVTFSYLYAGTVLRKPFFACGIPVLGMLVSGLVLLFFSYFCAAYFAKHTDGGTKGPHGYLAASFCVLCLVFCASMIVRFLASLSYFSADYGTLFVTASGLAACIFATLLCASHGRIAVSGFAFLTAVPFILWTLIGFFAFFETKKVFPLASPLSGFSQKGLLPLLAETLYFCLDTVFLAVVLCDRESQQTRKIAPRAFVRGTVLFLLVVGANLFKNLLLFGSKLATAAAYPDLAAIRLVPFFDLPELSVIMNTFACTVKISVYLACALMLLKNALGSHYSHKLTCSLVAAALGILSVSLCLINKNGLFENSDAVVLFLFCAAALLCFVIYHNPYANT